MNELAEAILTAKRVYLCGNGGSAANAVHIANDLIACGIKAQAITCDIATITAIANDFGYDQIFSRQLEALGEEGDLLIALSGSGNSPNILNALSTAKRKGIKTFAIIGGGKARELADESIMTHSNMQASEQAQLVIGHEVMKSIKDVHDKV